MIDRNGTEVTAGDYVLYEEWSIALVCKITLSYPTRVYATGINDGDAYIFYPKEVVIISEQEACHLLLAGKVGYNGS
jgi:hypothetical protein